MRRSFALLIAIALASLTNLNFAGDQPAAGWKPIFNGKDMTNWKMTGPGEFKVEDGELVTYGGMGLLTYEKEKLGNCEIKVVFKLMALNDNSGVYIRIPEPPKEPLNAYPWFAVNNGYEVQIDNLDNEWHRTGCLYSMTKAKAIVSPKVNEYAEMIIKLDGLHTTVTVNGEVVTDYKEGDEVPAKVKPGDPDRRPRPETGYIGLQNHGGHAHVHFKEVSIRELKK